MPVARFWRLNSFATSGGGALEISELQLIAGSTVMNTSIAASCTFAPAFGTLAMLNDASTASAVTWNLAQYSTSGFALVWDFGTGGIDLTALRIGSGSSVATFAADMLVDYSSDGVTWIALRSLVGVVYPGAFTLTTTATGEFAPVVTPTPARLRSNNPGLTFFAGAELPSTRAYPAPLNTFFVGAVLPDTRFTLAPITQLFVDIVYGGQRRIIGTVAEKGNPTNTPLRRRVLLVDERAQLVIRETWSDAVTGAYEFRGITGGTIYTVISYDHLRIYRAVAADNVVTEAIPV